MKEFTFDVSLHIDNDNMPVCLFRNTCNIDVTMLSATDKPILEMVERFMPMMAWKFDDGEDCKGTNFCQYVCYTDENSYLLATWNGFLKFSE